MSGEKKNERMKRKKRHLEMRINGVYVFIRLFHLLQFLAFVSFFHGCEAHIKCDNRNQMVKM